jgi:hypothetical protein
MACLPRYRAILAVDIESSATRTDPVKAALRNTAYDLFEHALRATGIGARHRDPFTDRGDGILALVHPVDQAPKPILLGRTIPTLAQLLADHNATRPVAQHPQRLRLRAVVHAGEIHYDNNGCFGEALDLAFRLLDAPPVKKTLQLTQTPLVLVISEHIHHSIVRHGYDDIDQQTYHQLVHVQVGGHRHRGWIHVPGQPHMPRTPAKLNGRQPGAGQQAATTQTLRLVRPPRPAPTRARSNT